MTTNYIGEPLDRVDGRLKVTGKAIYSGDRHPDNLAYGCLLTSTVANGSILAMDTSKVDGLVFKSVHRGCGASDFQTLVQVAEHSG
ncbi:MAG TPA: hypothetical protein VGH07_00110 [Chthoniobacterales bacterium]|jgi:CO/xanthine dehydrogenase Mo-binding subunit